MKTNTLLKIALLIMVVLNIAVITMMLGKQKMPRQGRNSDIKTVIIEKLQLDKRQEAIYSELAKKHHKGMSKINQEQRPLIREYFNFLKLEDQNPATQDALLSEINLLERDKLTMTYAHFEELKEICNQDQQILFEGIIGEVIQVLIGDEKEFPPRPRD